MFKLSKKTKLTYTRNLSNIFKVNNKDTRTMPATSIVNFEHILVFILLLLLLNLVWEDIVSNNKFVFSKCEKCVILWAGKVCLATRFHLYSPKTRLQKDNFSRQPFTNISQTLKCHTIFDHVHMHNKLMKYRLAQIKHLQLYECSEGKNL